MAKWEQKLNAALALHGDRRVNGKVASVRTQNLTKEVLYAAFRRLEELGYLLQGPEGVKDKHIHVLVRDWWFTKKKTAKTIQNELSRLRVFFNAIGKHNLVGKVDRYLFDVDRQQLVVHAAAKASKSWVAKGVDMREVFQRIDAKDFRLGLMVRMQVAFGLRREEVIKCMPHVQDRGVYFEVLPGQGKNGRTRAIPATERQLLDFVKDHVKPHEVLGWKSNRSGETPSLKQNLRRYSHLMSSLGYTKIEFGTTGHGLRAQFAENIAMLCGVLPPSLGGTRGQMRREELRMRMKQISEALGHHRPEIVAAYFCAFGRDTYKEDDFRTLSNLEDALAVLATQVLPVVVQEDRRADCIKIRNALEALGCDLNLRQVHVLWDMASNREGLEWKTPTTEVAILMEGAALTILANELKTMKAGAGQ